MHEPANFVHTHTHTNTNTHTHTHTHTHSRTYIQFVCVCVYVCVHFYGQVSKNYRSWTFYRVKLVTREGVLKNFWKSKGINECSWKIKGINECSNTLVYQQIRIRIHHSQPTTSTHPTPPQRPSAKRPRNYLWCCSRGRFASEVEKREHEHQKQRQQLWHAPSKVCRSNVLVW